MPRSDQDVGIAAGGIKHVEVVERAVKPATLHELLRKGALAGLPRASHDNRGHDPEPLAQCHAHQARKRLHSVDDNHS